jgi:hypothetical protein
MKKLILYIAFMLVVSYPCLSQDNKPAVVPEYMNQLIMWPIVINCLILKKNASRD